jgi:glycerol-3-phosphate dehydrogenase
VKRDLAAFGSKAFDLVVVGGGITGACIARDAARRGLSVALIEKDDFSAATSAGSSKLVHGGLRYLKTMEFGLVRESLRERRIWQRIAPHLVYPLPFLVPAYSTRDRWTLRAGLTLYDALSFDRSWLDDPAQHMARSRWWSGSRVRSAEPVLDEPGLRGALRYFDCQMYSPERLAIECLSDACAHGAVVANYVEALDVVPSASGGAVDAIRLRDGLTGASHTVAGRVVVNAAGPWADLLLARFTGREPSRRLLRSKGIHLLVPALTKQHALTLAHRGGGASAGRGHFFVIPWRGHSLIGTTDVAFDRTLDRIAPTERDVADFLAVINRTLPSARLTLHDVRFAYAAIRPLIARGATSTYTASRRGEIVDHGTEPGLRNVISVIGGKWTTSRDAAEDATTLAVRKLGIRAAPCDTASAKLPGASFARFADLERDARDPRVTTEAFANLVRNYGSRYREVLALADADPDLAAPVVAGRADVAAQVAFAFRSEMAVHLHDVVFRRTGIGTLGALDDAALADLVTLARKEGLWDDAECARQAEAVRVRYVLDRS